MLSIVADKIHTIEQAREQYARCLMLDWDSVATQGESQKFMQRLEETLQPFAGGQCRLVVNYFSEDTKASLQLGDAWRVRPTDDLIYQLQGVLIQENAIQIKYR